MEDTLLHTISDGVLRGVFLCIINEFFFSSFAGDSIETILFRTGILSIVLMVFVFLLTHKTLSKMLRKKSRVIYYFSSFFVFLLSLFCVLVAINIFHLNLFPDREFTNADGVVLLYIDLAFILISGLLRMGLFVVHLLIHADHNHME